MKFGGSLATPTTRAPPHSLKRAALFIDGANAWAAAKSLQFEMDWEKVLHHYQINFDLLRAYYYTAIPDGDAPLRPMVDWLSYNGYVVKTKPTKEFKDPISGRTKLKGNMDLDMALDVYDIALHTDVSDIILFTGDGDFRVLVERIQLMGCRVHVVSSTKTEPSMIADELRRQIDVFVELEEMRNQFKRG